MLSQENTVFQRELDLANESHARLCREYQMLKREGEVVKSHLKEAEMVKQEKEQESSHLKKELESVRQRSDDQRTALRECQSQLQERE